LAILLFWCGCGPVARAGGDTVIPLKNTPYYADVSIQLQALVNNFGFHDNNYFCVIAYKSGEDGTVTAYVYWPTQNKLIVWGVGSSILLASTDYFDLLRDIAPSPADIPPQDFILPWTKADVISLVQDCHAQGSIYTVMKTTDGWAPIRRFSEFSSVEAQLQYLVDNNSSAKVNNFCVVGQKDGVYTAAYIYWQNQNRLIYWLPGKYDVDDPFAVSDSPVQIDLNHGLRDEEDSSDERNEMQRSYATAIVRACRRTGQQFVIRKSN